MATSHAKLTLHLLQAGAPNAEILTATSVTDLRAIAARHGIALPFDDASAAAVAAPAVAAPTGEVAPSSRSSHDAPTPRGVYEGERNERGEWEGRGRYRFADGMSYEGEFVANQQHGRGTMRYASGASYVGGWRAGRKHGSGAYYWNDGRIEVGFYENDQSVGEVRAPRRPAFFAARVRCCACARALLRLRACRPRRAPPPRGPPCHASSWGGRRCVWAFAGRHVVGGHAQRVADSGRRARGGRDLAR
jgi:hypothetical protein